MKKVSLLIFVSLILLLAFTSCSVIFGTPSEDPKPEHEHEWTEATCEAPKTCATCGEVEGAALGHDWAEATCTALKTCKTCEKTEGEALGHDWAAADCTTPKTCKTCGETDGAALGHNWNDATCTDPKTCKTCGATDGEAKGHTWSDPTCTAPKTCTACGTEEGEALGHTEEVVPGKDATCTATGLTEGKKCSVCGETLVAQEIIPMLDHTEEVVPGKDATCTESGLTEGKKCSVCGETIVAQTEIPKLGHTEETLEAVDATCTSTGLTEGKKCSVCGETLVAQETIPALDHIPMEAGEENRVEPSCKAPGGYDTVVRCFICDGIISSVHTELAQLEHVFGEYVYNNDATCENDGTETATCTLLVCGGVQDTRVKEGTKLGHEMPADAACGEHWNCVRFDECGYTSPEALAHDYADATCQVLATCKNCGATTGELAPCVPGAAVEENRVAPQCELAGSYDLVTYCTVCGTECSREAQTIDPTGHNMAPATCDAPSTCKNGCGKTEGEAVANHTPVGTVVDGHVVYTCATCSDSFTTEQELVYNGEQTNYLFSKNGDITMTAKDGQYDILAGDTAPRSQYMLYMPSNDKNAAGTMTGWNSTNESFGVFSFRVKLNVNLPNEAFRVIVMSSRNNPNWDANGAWSGNSIDILAFMPNLDGTYRVFGNSMTSNTFATVNADEWVDVKMFMQINKDGLFTISYYINGEFCNVYTRDLVNSDPSKSMTIKNLDINCAYMCGYAGPGTGVSLDDVYFGYAKNQEWLFDEHEHVWADATCTAPKTCTACGLTEGSALGHVEKTRDENVLLPDCVNEGHHDVVTYCDRCQAELGRETVTDAALGHLESTISGTPATCTENGTTDKKVCTREGCANPVLQDHQPILATGHKDENADNLCDACGTELTCDHEGTERVPVTGTAPTCTAKGLSDGEKCAKCGQFTVPQTEIDALGHTEATRRENEVAPTCTADGKYDLVTYCSVCNVELSRANETVDPKLGHAEVAHAGKAPTCTEKGWKDYVTCSRCDYTTYEEIAATGHTWSGAATCVSGKTCTACGASDPQLNPNGHNIQATYAGGKLFYACQLCDYRFDVDTFVYHDGSNATIPGSNYTGTGAQYNGGTNKYASNGDYVYAITDHNADKGEASQMQLWVPGIKNGDGTFKGFSLNNAAVGVLSLKTKLSLTHASDAFSLKLVESGWGATGCIDINVLAFTPVFDATKTTFQGKINVYGYSNVAGDGSTTLLKTLEVDSENWTEWVDIKVMLTMNTETGNLDALYYINGEFVHAGTKKVTTTGQSICSVYGNLNAWNQGTGVMLDDIAFGYTAHKHNLVATQKDGALVYACECGTTFRVTDYRDWNGDGNDSGYKNVPNGNVTLNVNGDGQYEYIFKPETDTAPDFSADGTQSGNGWYEYDKSGVGGGQLQMWMPSNNRGEGTFSGFSCENNAVGVISFSMKTNMARHADRDTSLTFSVGKPRNASDWNDGGSWTDDSINIFTIEEYQASGIVLRGGKGGTSTILATIPVADGWSEWFDVQIVIALSSDGTMNTYYYINSAYCGMYSRNITAAGEDGRYLNPQKIEALQISGWTYTPNTGIVFDDFYFGYEVNGHNTLDGQLHKLPADATCAAEVTCSCGWTGIAATHTFAADCSTNCSACGAANPNAAVHDSLTVGVKDGQVTYTCSDCNYYYAADNYGLYYDGNSEIGAFTKNGDMVSEVVDGVNHVYLKDTDGAQYNANGDQFMMWVPSQSTPAEFDGFTCANNALGFVSFKINAYTDSATGAEFKVNDARGTSAFDWSKTSVGIFKIMPVTSDSQTTVKITGLNGDALTELTLPEGSKWTGWFDVVILIKLSDDNTMSVDYYINGSYIGNITKGMLINTNKISTLYLNGYTKGEGTGYYLDDVAFGYTLGGMHEVIPAKEPIYKNEIAKEEVINEALKTIVASKLKQCDQTSAPNVEGGTPVFVIAEGKDGQDVEALYISRTYPWTTETVHFTEFRFAINGEAEGPAVTSISFDYKIDGTVEKNERYEFTDFDGTKFYSDAYVQVKTLNKNAEVIEQAGDNYPEIAGTDLVLDGEWHTMTIEFETPRYLIDFLLNLYHFQGELLIANINVEFVKENNLYNEDGSLKVTEIGTRNASEDNTANVTDAALLTIVDGKIKQFDQTNKAAEGDTTYGYFVKEVGTSHYVTLEGKDGNQVEAVYLSRSVDWDTYASVSTQNGFKSEFRFAIDNTKRVTSISFDYILNGSLTGNRSTGNANGQLSIFQIKYTNKADNTYNPNDQYFDVITDKVDGENNFIVTDGEWHTFSYTFENSVQLDNFLIILSEFQGELVLANLVVTYE